MSKLGLYWRIVQIQLAARRDGCKTKEEALAWAMKQGMIVDEGCGHARVRSPKEASSRRRRDRAPG